MWGFKLKHHTKEKGDIGVTVIIADLSKKGFKILTPLSEHLPFDIVAYNVEKDKFYKIQCKYSSKTEAGVVNVKLISSYSTKNGCSSTRYKFNSFDVIAVYCPETDCVYYLNSDFTDKYKNSIKLRLEPARNGQSSDVNLAIDFIKFPE